MSFIGQFLGRFVGIAVMAIVPLHLPAQAPGAGAPPGAVLQDATVGVQDAVAPLPDSIAAALASDDKKAVKDAVVRLRKGTPDDRALLKRLLDHLGPFAGPPEPARSLPPGPAKPRALPDSLRDAVAAMLASDAKKSETAVAELTAAAQKGDADVVTLATRADALAKACVLDTFAAATQSRAVFAGQFAALKDYGPAVEKVLVAWLEKAPAAVSAETLKPQCVRALRDIVTPPNEPVTAQLAKVAKDAKESRAVQKEAAFALAQFGNRTLVDPQIQALQADSKSETAATRARAFLDLAEVYYNLREYAAAGDAYDQYIQLIEADEALRRGVPSLPTLYYNACCSLALAGKIDAAFARLEKAVELGKQGGGLPRSLLEVDMDIAVLRKDPRFQKIAAAIK